MTDDSKAVKSAHDGAAGTEAARGSAAKPAPTRVPRTGTPIERSTLRAEEIGRLTFDPAFEPSATRLRAIGLTPDLHPAIASGELVSMGTVFTAEHGGSLRTFSGGLAHECGWWPSAKAGRVQHWEGIAAHDLIVESECNQDVDAMQSEGVAFHFYLAPRWRTYTADMDMRVAGTRHVVEVKRTEDDLSEPEYRMTLAAVAEICRRCGWVFRIVLAGEIFAGRLHEDNCRAFADRRFVPVGRGAMDALEGFAIRRGAEAAWGELAEVLAPGATPLGEAMLQALALRRRVRVDLTARVYHHTPVTIL